MRQTNRAGMRALAVNWVRRKPRSWAAMAPLCQASLWCAACLIRAHRNKPHGPQREPVARPLVMRPDRQLMQTAGGDGDRIFVRDKAIESTARPQRTEPLS